MKNYRRTNFKLTFEKSHTCFYVNEKKKTVVCKMCGIMTPPHSDDYKAPINLPYEEVEGVGVAKCCAEDMFDVERGKRIAMARAENNAYKNALKHLEEIYEHLLLHIKAIVNFEKKTIGQCTHNVDYIESINNPEHPRYKKELRPIKHKTINV